MVLQINIHTCRVIWIFQGAPLKFSGAPENIQGNLAGKILLMESSSLRIVSLRAFHNNVILSCMYGIFSLFSSIRNSLTPVHYTDVIIDAMAFEITSHTIVYSNVYSGADQREHQSSASLAFLQGIHRWPVNSPQQRDSNAENVFIWWRHHVSSCDPVIDASNLLLPPFVSSCSVCVVCLWYRWIRWRLIIEVPRNMRRPHQLFGKVIRNS